MSFLRDLWNKEKKVAEPAVKQVKFQGDFGPILADFEVSYAKAEKLSRDLAREVETLVKLAKQLENTGTSYREKLKNALKTASPNDRRQLDILQEKVAALLNEAAIRAGLPTLKQGLQTLGPALDKADRALRK